MKLFPRDSDTDEKDYCNGSLSCVGTFIGWLAEIMIEVHDTHDANCDEGYTAGYEVGYNDGKQECREQKVLCTVFGIYYSYPLNDSCRITLRIRRKTIAVVHPSG